MTTFALLEQSLEGSRPVELFTFALGATVFDYTSNPAPITVGTTTYMPVTITRTAIGQGVEERKRVVTFTLPANDPFAARFIGAPPGDPASVSMFRLQRDETPTPARVLQYKGDVNDVRFVDNGQLAEIVTRTIEALASKTIPRYTFAGQCQHVLYGPGCDVNPTTFQLFGTVTAVVGNVVTVNGANTKPNDYFRGGFCRVSSGGDYRLILAHTGNNITLAQPFLANINGAELQLFAGCDHVYTGDCKSRFANQERFGGFPWVPTKNPFATGIR
jgi:uncharacterized phage protein (TIGR02218 family)